MRIDPSGANAGYALGTTEPLIQDAFAEQIKSGDVVWDIGANIGFYSLIAARLAGDGEVIAFEPLPANLAAIRRNLALNGLSNVKVLGIALADTEGTADLQIHSELTWAKLDTSADTAFQQELAVAGHVTVQLSTIDRQLEILPPPDVVKIDIEGAEVAALRGASKLLSTHRPNRHLRDARDQCRGERPAGVTRLQPAHDRDTGRRAARGEVGRPRARDPRP